VTAIAALIDNDRRVRLPIAPADEDRVEWGRLLPFFVLHLGCFGAIWTGVSDFAVLVCVLLYAVRMFAITAVYHRYLSHRTYEAPRWLVFLGAWTAASAAQRGPLWWAAHHRNHHRYSDEAGDAHSPLGGRFWWSHVGWFTTRRNFHTDLQQVPDFAPHAELRWLDRFDIAAPLSLIVLLYVLGEVLAVHAPGLQTSGWQLVVFGFCISTTLVFHVTSMVNSVCHLFGKRPFETGDQSRNLPWLAVLTFGEGWHNNHHFCPGSVRQGFRWWQIDLSFYILWAMARAGLIQLRPIPERVTKAVAARTQKRHSA
jgi:stearoyl-CoA desaturase (delta-9 desaturase)